MKSFFGAIKNKTLKVRLPRYLPKGGNYPIIDRMVYKPNKKYFVLPRSNVIKKVSNLYSELKYENKDLDLIHKLNIKIKTPNILRNKEIKEITIKLSLDKTYFKIYYVYKTNEVLPINNNEHKEMGIDFGYNNLAFCATNNNHLLLDGLKIKSLNQWYHKRMSYLQSLRPNQKTLTKKMYRLIEKRNNQMTYYINKAAKLIVTFCLKEKVTNVYIGYNKGFKDINLSKQFNQMSRSIPIARLRDRIVYLLDNNNIETRIVNESYTSKASFIDRDIIGKGEFCGSRVKRGLYKSKEGKLINADLNAALNIIRKCNPEFEVGNRGLSTPRRVLLN